MSLPERRLRLAICTSVHPSADARVTYRQGRMLASAFDATLYVLEDGPDGAAAATEPGRSLTIRRLGAPRSRLRRFLAGRRLLRTALADAPDIVLVHDPELLPWLGPVVGRGAVTAYDVHEDYPSWMLLKTWIPGVLRRPVAAAVDALERSFAAKVDVLVVADTWLSTRFAERTGSRAPVLVRNYAPEDLFDEGEGVGARDRTVVYVGGVTAARGLDAMLAAISLVRETLPDASLRIVGPAQDRSAEAVAAAPGVDFAGRRRYDDVAAELRCARAGIALLADTPKYRRNVPSKLFDYMAAGLPYVTSDFENIREASGGAGGIFVDPADPRAVADALAALLTDTGLFARLREEGLAAYRERFRFAPEGERLIEALRAASVARAGAVAPSGAAQVEGEETTWE